MYPIATVCVNVPTDSANVSHERSRLEISHYARPERTASSLHPLFLSPKFEQGKIPYQQPRSVIRVGL